MNPNLREPSTCEESHKVPGLSDTPVGLSEVAVARREQILDAAETIITGHRIQKLSLGRIEDQAGMSRGQLTYYFPTKESILLAVYDRMLRRMIGEAMRGDGPKPMTGRAWACLQHGLGKHLDPAWPPPAGRELFSLLYTFLAQMGHRDDYRKRLSNLYQEWRGHIANDIRTSVSEPHAVPPRVVAALIQALIHGLDVQLQLDPEAFDRQEMLAACVSLLAPLFKQTPNPDPAPAAPDTRANDGDNECAPNGAVG